MESGQSTAAENAMGPLMTSGQDLGFSSAPKDEVSPNKMHSVIRYRERMIIKNQVPPQMPRSYRRWAGLSRATDTSVKSDLRTSKCFSIKQFQLLVIFTNNLPHQSINWS